MGQNGTSSINRNQIDQIKQVVSHGEHTEQLVILGSIGSPFGVIGWLRINSYTEPKLNILNYKNWILLEKTAKDLQYKPNLVKYSVKNFKVAGGQILGLLAGVEDRTTAASLTNYQIAVPRQELPKLTAQEYYWADLLGCKVYDLTQKYLGELAEIFTTGANPIMVVRSPSPMLGSLEEYLIPYDLEQVVSEVDLSAKKILVNWDLKYL